MLLLLPCCLLLFFTIVMAVQICHEDPGVPPHFVCRGTMFDMIKPGFGNSMIVVLGFIACVHHGTHTALHVIFIILTPLITSIKLSQTSIKSETMKTRVCLKNVICSKMVLLNQMKCIKGNI